MANRFKNTYRPANGMPSRPQRGMVLDPVSTVPTPEPTEWEKKYGAALKSNPKRAK